MLKPLIHKFSPDTVKALLRRRSTAGLLALCLPAVGLINACDSDYSDTLTGELSTGDLTFSLPSRIRNIEAINPNAVRAIATVNNQQYSMTRAGNGTYQTSIAVNTDTLIRVSVSFSETLPGGTVIELASHPGIERNTGTSNLTMQFFDNDYSTEEFDLDGDGCSNIVEREEETDPLINDAIPPNFVRAISFDLPASIPNPQFSQAIVTVAETPRAVRKTGIRFQSSGAVPQCSNAGINVLILQQFNGSTLVVATATIAHGTSTDIVLSANDFNFNEDADGDGRTNVTELQNGTNPFVAD